MSKEIVGAISQLEQLKSYWKELCKEEKLVDNRHQRNVMFRHAFLVAVREVSSLGITDIGQIIGKHHATVIHATKNHDSNMRFNSIYRQAYVRILSTISDMMLIDLDYEEYNGLRDENRKLRSRLMAMAKRNRELISSKLTADERAMKLEARVSALKEELHGKDVRISALNKKIASIAW